MTPEEPIHGAERAATRAVLIGTIRRRERRVIIVARRVGYRVILSGGSRVRYEVVENFGDGARRHLGERRVGVLVIADPHDVPEGEVGPP